MNTPERNVSIIFSQLVSLWRHLSSRRRRQVGLLLILMLVSAFSEVVALGAVLPFLGVLSAPDRVMSQPLVANIAAAWGVTSAEQLVLPLAVLFAVAALVAGAIRMLLLWANNRLAFAAGADFSIDIYRRTLYQPYHTHLSRNSSVVISSIIYKVADAIGVLLAMLTILSSAVLLLAITSTLLVIDPIVAMMAAIGFFSIYGLITWLLRRRFQRNSQWIAWEQDQLIKALQEGLGGIRDVLLNGTQEIYCSIYRQADQRLRRAQGNNNFLGQSPRYAMEALGMALIAAFAYGLSQKSGGIGAALPLLGVLALGAQRLLPALQQGYAAWAQIAGSQASLADVLVLLDQPLPPEARQPAPAPLSFQDTIRFDKVCFRYGSDTPWVLKDLCFTVPKSVRVGFVGSTGSGKSTTLDLLMGLLEPTQGQVLVDGQSIGGDRRRAWQQTIAHVPQSIYLADTTLAENIAFGVPRDAIDLQRVRQAARQAQIADFIESGPEGYNALVGERGVRLSGGQRQRIGIARALYKRASVLVFDEATSALDNATEQAVMDAISNLDRDLTILLIAHRLTTVRRCDTIIELGHGQMVAQGTYEQLLECSPSFRDMAKTAVA